MFYSASPLLLEAKLVRVVSLPYNYSVWLKCPEHPLLGESAIADRDGKIMKVP